MNDMRKHEFIIRGQSFTFNASEMNLKSNEENIIINLTLQKKEFAELEKGMKYLSLHIIHACIMKCEYCYGSGGKYGSSSGKKMSLKTIYKSIDFLFANSKDNQTVHVNFFGGEPFLAFHEIKNAVSYAREQADFYKKNIEFSVSTSGFILNKEILSFLLINKFSVSISIDGFKENHDRHRKTSNNEKTFDKIVSNFKRINEVGITTLITSTVTHYTITALDQLNSLLEIGIRNIRFKTVTGDLDKLNLTKEDFIKLMESYDRLCEKYLLDILAEKYYDLGDYTKWIHRIISQKSHRFNCTAGSNYFNIDPDGIIYLCHKFVASESQQFGNVNNEHHAIAKINFDVDQTNCSSCWAKYICGGGCYYDGMHKNDCIYDTANIDKCLLYRKQIEGALYIYYNMERASKTSSFLKAITSTHNSYQNTV